MRNALIVAAVVLGGCSVQKAELNRPYIAARLESPKQPQDFGSCAATALGTTLQHDEGIYYLIRTGRHGVQETRWDFFPATSGSQAELRTGNPENSGVDDVRACA